MNLIIFIVSGFWHGANWTFIVWGALNAIYFLPLLLTKRNRKNTDTIAKDKILPTFKEFFQMFSTFLLTVFGWIFFRAENIHHAISYISRIFSSTIFYRVSIPGYKISTIKTIILVCIFIILEWNERNCKYAIEKFGFKWNQTTRWAMYYLIIIVILWFGGKEQQFIYFQF